MQHQNEKQLYLQQAFKELSLSINQQRSTKYTNTMTNTNRGLTATQTTPAVLLSTSKSSPTPRHEIKKPKSFSTLDILGKQQPLPYLPLVDRSSCSSSTSSFSRTSSSSQHEYDTNSSNHSTNLLQQKSYSASLASLDSPLCSASSASSIYSGDSIPSTPTLPPMTLTARTNGKSKGKKMRRIPSSTSSNGSFTTYSSTRSKHSGNNMKWDWTIEEDAFQHSNLDQISTLPPPHQKNKMESNTRLISTLETTERDMYGFKKPIQWIKLQHLHQFEQHYQSILLHQQEKWTQLMAEHDDQFPPINSKLRRYVRKGIPHVYRGKAWMHYSGAKRKMEAHTGLYESLLASALSMETQNEFAEVIRRDLHRTFPDNTHFACARTDQDGNVIMDPESNPKLVSMKHILYAFSIHSPQIGYCQSLNYLVGIFLLFVESEEEAFWLLVCMVHDYCPSSMYDLTMEGSNIDQVVLMMMVYECMPSIWNKLANGKCFWECEQTDTMPSITLVTNHWFLTAFINIMPMETVLRIWDCFFIEGYQILFKVALTIIKMNEHSIWSLDDPIDVFPLLQNMPRKLMDCHRFMERVFSPSGIAADLTPQEIERKRSLFKDRRKQRRQAKFKHFVLNS